MAEAVLAADPGAEFELSAEWLVSRSFVFGALPRGAVLSRALRFEVDGAIAGYSHANETRWSIQDGQLYILTESGQPSCILTAGVRDGRVSLSGPFINPAEPSVPTDTTHYIEEKVVDPEIEVMTFDLFDTLVARRCFDPLDIFHAVERKSGVVGFARARHEVEMRMFGRRLYGFDDIYAQLLVETSWGEKLVQKLKMMELAEEWDNLFPIGETVALVRPRDLIISDMYLPFDFVRKIVDEKCGLQGRPIHLSNYGKHFGVIWPILLPNHEIVRHFGDNPHADVVSPGRHGIQSQHVTISQWLHGERVLLELGLRPYAQAIREARLRAYDDDPKLRAVQAAQLQINLPLLTIGSLYLAAKSQEWDADTLLMCSRDCNLWEPLLRVLLQRSARSPRVRYIRTSRKLFYSASAEYEAYFQFHMGERNYLVDLVGTGQSPSRFLQTLGDFERVRPLLLVGEPAIDQFEGRTVESLTKQEFVPVRLILEALNLSLDGTATSAVFANHAIEILQAPNEFSPTVKDSIAAMRRAFLGAVDVISETTQAPIPENLSVATLQQAADAIFALIPHHFEGVRPIVDEVLHNLK